MARVTVEDCVTRIPNRFELVMVSAKRTREIASGSPLTVDRDNDKNTVVSLREIADETVSIEDLKESLIRHHQRVVEVESDEEPIDLMEGEEEWASIAREAADMEEKISGEETAMQETTPEEQEELLAKENTEDDDTAS